MHRCPFFNHFLRDCSIIVWCYWPLARLQPASLNRLRDRQGEWRHGFWWEQKQRTEKSTSMDTRMLQRNTFPEHLLPCVVIWKWVLFTPSSKGTFILLLFYLASTEAWDLLCFLFLLFHWERDTIVGLCRPKLLRAFLCQPRHLSHVILVKPYFTQNCMFRVETGPSAFTFVWIQQKR